LLVKSHYGLSALGEMKYCTQLQIHTSCPSTSQLLFWNVLLEILWANSV